MKRKPNRVPVLRETTPAPPGSVISYGSILDFGAQNPLLPESRAARGLGLNLFYCYRPPHTLRKGRLNIVALATQVYAEAVSRGTPHLFIEAGERVPAAFRYAREIEVGTVIAWPNGDVWARTGILESRGTSMQKAFVCSTGLDLPVADRRVKPVRRGQAIAVTIALVAIAFGKPLPPYPCLDSQGRSARDLAKEAGGLDVYVLNWS